MKVRIVADSSCDLSKEMKNDMKVEIVEMAGLSSTYADDGGIVIAF